MSATADDSHNLLPHFPRDKVDVGAAASRASGRARRRLELVLESSGAMDAGTQDLFAEDENDVAATEIYVRVTVAPPADLASQRRFDEFWLAEAAPEPEAPAVYRPVFPTTPWLERPAVRASLVWAAAIAFAAFGIGSLIFAVSFLLGSP